ncbi:hypothetical protein Clacol_000318 [Clathrus columnatus]|uniref:Uncharacterized protein n=1 Tax=Clathrus columnatus TaxID=1419009 RepID=A0AAV5A0C4_9AGAM|nr:hypothetical protein Clacol_000318 [Clathrus columnatus]
MFIPCSNDPSFGPGSACRALDFTLFFENTILSIIPDVVFFACAVARVCYLRKKPSTLRQRLGILFLAKAIVVLLILASHAAQLAVLFRERNSETPGSVPAVIVSFVVTLLLGILVYVEHFRSLAPSTLVVTYGLIKGIFGSAILRTFSAIDMLKISSRLYFATAICTAGYLSLLAVELCEKRSILSLAFQNRPREETSSILTRSLYIWLFPILWRGHHSRLTFQDLVDIPTSIQALPSRKALEEGLHSNSSSNPDRSLVRATIHAFGFSMLGPIFPRLILLLLTFAQPLLVTDMISFTQNPEIPNSRGWALVGGFVCVFGLMVFATAIYWEEVFQNTVEYRAALVGSIYLKTLRLSTHESSIIGSGAASTYMSVDVERVIECFQFIHELWAAVASIALAVLILWFQANWAAFMPAAVIIIVLFLLSYIGKLVGKRQSVWMKATDKRIKFLSSILSQFLPVKWSAYESIFEKHIEKLRREETRHATYFYRMATIAGTISNNAGIMSTLSVLGTYAGVVARHGGPPLDVNRLFTIATTVNLMSSPLSTLGYQLPGQYTPSLFAGYASLKRLQEFLRLEEKLTHADLHNSCPAENLTISMKDASFSWNPTSDSYLKNLTLNIRPGKFHMCIGPGKTMLLHGILGETYVKNGDFVPPTCPISTFRENVCLGKPFEEKYYYQIISACDLGPDLDRLPHGDQTRLGDKGNSLSGGQKQRLALARALYARNSIILLDDVFSALDAQTEVHVHHLDRADNIIVLEAGTVQYQGSLTEIRNSGFDLDRHIESTESLASTSVGDAVYPNDSIEKEKTPATDNDQNDREDLASTGVLTSYKFFMKMNGYHRAAISAVSLFRFTCMAFLKSSYILVSDIHELRGGSICCTGQFLIVSSTNSTADRYKYQAYLQIWSESNGKDWGAWLAGYGGISILNVLSCAFAVWYYTYTIATYGALRIHSAEVHALFSTSPGYFMSTPVGRIINRFSQGTSKQLQSLETASKSPLYTLFATTLDGLTTIRRTGLALITFFLAIGLSILAVALRRATSAASLGLALSNLTQLTSLLSTFLVRWSDVENGTVGLERICQIVRLPHEEAEVPNDSTSTPDSLQNSIEEKDSSDGNGDEKVSPVKSGPWAPRGLITFRNVTVRYKSGKSTIVLSLFRALEKSLTSGIIEIDGVNIQTLPVRVLRQSMSLVSQDPFLWHASLRSNLDPENEADDDEIWKALESVGGKTAVLDLSASRSEGSSGLDMVLEDGGLSRGQKQLLCLARVLLRKRKIVILDEASSSMDYETDERIRNVIQTQLKGQTVVAVAHRIATIIDFDVILVMDQGSIAEYGSPRELLADRHSRFYSLAATQGLVGALS